jgi:hypothetical protein
LLKNVACAHLASGGGNRSGRKSRGILTAPRPARTPNHKQRSNAMKETPNERWEGDLETEQVEGLEAREAVEDSPGEYDMLPEDGMDEGDEWNLATPDAAQRNPSEESWEGDLETEQVEGLEAREAVEDSPRGDDLM